MIDLAANYGGHIIGIPRDNLPVLEKQDGSGPLWAADDGWQPVTPLRSFAGARRAILAFGAPAFLAAEAADILNERGEATDVYVVIGLPLPAGCLESLISRYTGGVVTVEDGKIRHARHRTQGFCGFGGHRGIDLGHCPRACGPHRSENRPFRRALVETLGALRHYRRTRWSMRLISL